MEKTSLRARLLKDRHSISSADWKLRSQQICQRIVHHPRFQNAEKVALYRSFRNEVDISSLLELRAEKRYYFPRTHLALGTMEFLLYHSEESFASNKWGVSEPAEGESLHLDSSTLILVPGLAFDRKGHRLGYGKGFYDRFLSKTYVPTIGVCFAEFLFESLPAEAHDKTVDSVITELGSLDVSR